MMLLGNEPSGLQEYGLSQLVSHASVILFADDQKHWIFFFHENSVLTFKKKKKE